MSVPNLTSANILNSRPIIPNLPPGFCLTTDNIKSWLSSMAISTKLNASVMQYTIGTMDSASVEDRDKPRFMVDDSGRLLGLAVWMPDAQGWNIGGQIGELKTIVRTAASVVLDLAARPLAGWKLADGTAVGIPDLTPKPSASPPYPPIYFIGTAPDWTVYTVAYVG